LMSDPVETEKFSPNPHAWITDVSDFMNALLPRLTFPLSKEQAWALNSLSFELEQHSHFPSHDATGAIVFAGDFPEYLFSTLEKILAAGNTPNPKIRLTTASRDLLYSISYLLDLKPSKFDGQPNGKLEPGSTFIFELYSNSTVRALLFQDSLKDAVELLPPTTIKVLRSRVSRHQAQAGGGWRTLCANSSLPPPIDGNESFEFRPSALSRWMVFLISAVLAFFAFQRGMCTWGWWTYGRI